MQDIHTRYSMPLLFWQVIITSAYYMIMNMLLISLLASESCFLLTMKLEAINAALRLGCRLTA